jgi:hypothetical protein
MEAFVAYGTRGFASRWASDAFDASVIDEIKNAGRELLERLSGEGRGKNAGPVTICVTHDLTIVALLSLSYDIGSDGFHWPGFLEGAVLSERDSGWSMHYQGADKPVY